jgi:hypothetical protein
MSLQIQKATNKFVNLLKTNTGFRVTCVGIIGLIVIMSLQFSKMEKFSDFIPKMKTHIVPSENEKNSVQLNNRYISHIFGVTPTQ